MASIFKRKLKDCKGLLGVLFYVLKVIPLSVTRSNGKQEGENWAQQTERSIKCGQFKFDQHKHLHTFTQLVDRFISSANDTLRHLDHWENRLGAYALIHITGDLVGKERQILAETSTRKKKPNTIDYQLLKELQRLYL